MGPKAKKAPGEKAGASKYAAVAVGRKSTADGGGTKKPDSIPAGHGLVPQSVGVRQSFGFGAPLPNKPATPSKKHKHKGKDNAAMNAKLREAAEARKMKILLLQKGRKMRILDKVYQAFQKWKKAVALSRIDSGEIQPGKDRTAPRYKAPIEKLLKAVKKARIEEIPPDINIHRHPIRRPSWGGSRGVRKEVDILRETLVKAKRMVQPKVGWEYNKRQKRLLLGRRHRVLEKGWAYFEPIKKCLPRNIRPNSHVPDALFFIFSTMLAISLGIHYGVMSGIGSFMLVMEDAVEYNLTRNGVEDDQLEAKSEEFWDENAEYDKFVPAFLLINTAMSVLVILGFIGAYITDQTIHCLYSIGIIFCLIYKFLIARKANLQENKFCAHLNRVAEPLLQLLVDQYYETIEARDRNGQPVMWTNPETGVADEIVRIRTYKASNLMDRIQKSWQCCGVEGFSSYSIIPSTCCSPLWTSNPYCAISDNLANSSKLHSAPEGESVGCLHVLERFCKNAEFILADGTMTLLIFQATCFIISCYGLVMQARQIRQLKRHPHLRISAGTISQSLQTSAGTESAIKTGGGGVQAVADASKMTQKQTEHLQQMKFEAAKHRAYDPLDEETDSSSSEGSDEPPVTTVNFAEMQNLQYYVDKEDIPEKQKMFVEKAVEGFAGRFNIVASQKLQPYVTDIFSSTYQNETNAGLEAINNILERQFAQHTTDYNWRKLLTKPKKEDISIAPSHQDVRAPAKDKDRKGS